MRLLKLGEIDIGEIRSKVILDEALSKVKPIVEDVRKKGDSALRYYTKKFDGVEIDNFRVSEDEVEQAFKTIKPEIIEALNEAYKNIREFHERQLPEEWSYEKNGLKLGQLIRPLQRVGCYIPGGRASYPSTVLMATIPARVAGVKEIACVSPPNKNGRVNDLVLVACKIVGVKEIYKVGGAQAIAALAYGTESIAKVQKIVGPGNIYVTAAKQLVSLEVAIDLPAGPSEVLIVAEEHANPEFIAFDLLAQAEHDPNACCILVTTSEKLAKEVYGRLLSYKIEANCFILIAENLEDALNFTNEFAPEHLELILKNPTDFLERVKNAGSVFIGEYSPVACGDYASGTNHILPTLGYAKTFSGLTVYDFLKFISFQSLDKKALEKLGKTIITLAEAEGLKMHAESIRKRVNYPSLTQGASRFLHRTYHHR
ncbi:MAG: histidinol dehydrogenase [Candidatus Hydrothermarchaeota archaeon]|nr:MAG: histidinol dehydrogenase [Candidatus Hydrothermarchaeota archaeon]